MYGSRFPTGPVILNPNSWQARGLVYWAPLHDGVGRSTPPARLAEPAGRRTLTPTGAVMYLQDGGVTLAGAPYLSGSDSGLPAGGAPRTYAFWAAATAVAGFGVVFSVGTMNAQGWPVLGYFENTTTFTWENWGQYFKFTTAADGRLRHYALTIENSVWSAYQNGRFVGSATLNTNTTLRGSITIGSNEPSFPLIGSVRDVRIYNYALSPGQIWSLASDRQDRFALWSDPLRRRPFAATVGGHKWYWSGPRYSGILGSGVA